MNLNKFIREAECRDRTGLSRCTRWRLEKEGEFPQRRKITKRTVGWLASEIEDWINGREAKGSDSPETAGFGRRKSMAGGANGHNR